MYGGEWEKPVTNPVAQIISLIQAQGLPPTVENVNRVRQQAPQRLPTPPIPPQPSPDRTVEGYQPHFSDGGGDNNTSALPPKRMGPYPMPPNEGGTPRPPDGAGDPVIQGNMPPRPPLEAGVRPPPAPSPMSPPPGQIAGPQPFPGLGRDILNLRPLLQLLTTPNASLNQTMLAPGAAEYAGNSPIGASGKVTDVPMEGTALEGPPKRPQLAAPQARPAMPAAPLAIAGPRAQQALPAPAPSGPGFSPEYAPGGARQLSGPGFSPEYNISSPATAAIDKAVPADEPVAPRAKRKARGRR